MTISDKSAKYIMCLILFYMSLQLPRIYVIAFILCVMNVQLDIHVYIYICVQLLSLTKSALYK